MLNKKIPLPVFFYEKVMNVRPYIYQDNQDNEFGCLNLD